MIVSVPSDDARQDLERERALLVRRIDELTVGGEVELEFDNDFADRAQVTGEIGENLSLADALQQQLSQVEAALEKMNDGTYGTCEVCGKEIGKERLEALPSTQRCLEHA